MRNVIPSKYLQRLTLHPTNPHNSNQYKTPLFPDLEIFKNPHFGLFWVSELPLVISRFVWLFKNFSSNGELCLQTSTIQTFSFLCLFRGVLKLKKRRVLKLPASLGCIYSPRIHSPILAHSTLGWQAVVCWGVFQDHSRPPQMSSFRNPLKRGEPERFCPDLPSVMLRTYRWHLKK